MLKLLRVILLICTLLCPAPPARAQTRALLIACSDFVTQMDLGSAISGNLHMIASAMLGSSEPLEALSIEDGTIGRAEALYAAVADAFAGADEDDLSILYLCTHGIFSSDDGRYYLLLSDGETETPIDAQMLCDALAGIQGEKLLIVDACFSGALLGRGIPPLPDAPPVPFLLDGSVHVLTSASGRESSWYYDSEGLPVGAVSYFASALSSGLGLYGTAEADADGDGSVTLRELHRYMSVAVPSSSCQLHSTSADSIRLPTAQGISLTRPLSGFSFGSSLMIASEAAFDFSFTVTRETAVQYRLVEYDAGDWNWAKAQTFMDAEATLKSGRYARSLTLPTVTDGDSGYLLLQVFSVSGNEITLCAERLLAVQSADADAELTLSCEESFVRSGLMELPVRIVSSTPAEISAYVRNEAGEVVARLASSQLTRPAAHDMLELYWDGCDAEGRPLPDGRYTLLAESSIAGRRVRCVKEIRIVSVDP